MCQGIVGYVLSIRRLLWIVVLVCAISAIGSTKTQEREPYQPASALADAAWRGDDQLVAELIEGGADVNAVEPESGATPLIWAVTGGDGLVVRRLLDAGSGPDVLSVDGQTALLLAISPRSLFPEYTELDVAARLDLMTILLDGGADPNLPPNGIPPVRRATNDGFPEAVVLLQSYGAVIDDTLLAEAMRYGEPEVAELALSAGADPFFIDPRSPNRTLLHLAAGSETPELVARLLELGLTVDAVDDYGATPLFLAVGQSDRETSRLLLDAGSDVNHIASDGRSPLVAAVEVNSAEVVELLLERDADSSHRIETGETALHLAIGRFKPTAVVAALLEGGADPNAVSNARLRPLNLAVQNPTTEQTQLLLDNGASLDPIEGGSSSALENAVVGGTLPNVMLLVESGAEITEMAVERAPEEIREYLDSVAGVQDQQ